MNKQQWFVYIIRAADNSLYTGVTTNLQRRFQEHLTGKGAKYLKGRQPIELVFDYPVKTRSQAQRLEYWIKKQTKPTKENIIKNKVSLPE